MRSPSRSRQVTTATSESERAPGGGMVGRLAPTPNHRGGNESPFYVPSFLHVLGGLVHRHRAFWLWLGRLESRLLGEQVRDVPIRMPIYICGLARSGSTLLHEVISSHPSVATHRMKDYPMVFTPYWLR